MCRALIAVIALLWASVVGATEVLVCEATADLPGGWGGAKHYEFRLAIDDMSRALVAAKLGDLADMKIIHSEVWAVSGSLKIYLLQPGGGKGVVRESKIHGFATRLPDSSKKGHSMRAVIYHGRYEDHPIVIRADVWDEGSPFFVFDTNDPWGGRGEARRVASSISA